MTKQESTYWLAHVPKRKSHPPMLLLGTHRKAEAWARHYACNIGLDSSDWSVEYVSANEAQDYIMNGTKPIKL